MTKNVLFVPDEIKQHLQWDAFEALMQMPGKAYRDVPGRKTIQLKINNKSYFIKQHFGVGWVEIFKNFLSFKLPILGAMTEARAIQKLDEIGIPTTPLVAYGQRGCNPASMQSFVMTEDLGDILTLEDICKAWLEASPNKACRASVFKALAQLAAKFHSAGLCHRDFYLCHFVVKKAEFENDHLNLHLIDLHRMLQGQKTNSSAVMKDVAGLYFSMQQIGLGAEDWQVFKQHYLLQSDGFWAQVDARAANLLAKFNSEKFQKRLIKEKSALD
jgi:UDP-glucose:(heptosyl)LPS alpha-1,3-glucosyltransferase/heptose I phosphotransferase